MMICLFLSGVLAAQTDDMEQPENDSAAEIVNQSNVKGSCPSPEDTKNTKTQKASEAFGSICKMIQKGDWKSAASLMTENAQKELVVEQVISALGMHNIELPIPMPAMENALDEIDNVLNKYELNELEIDTSKMFDIQLSTDGKKDSEGKLEPDGRGAGETEKSHDKIFEAVNKKGTWKVVGELWNAKQGCPLGMSYFIGKVEETEMDGDDVILKLKIGSTSEQNGAVVQIMAPPTIIRMINRDDQWLFDGTDPERTQKAMKEFMKNMPHAIPQNSDQNF